MGMLTATSQMTGSRDQTGRVPLTRDEVMTASEVAELLHLPVSTVYYLARRGELPASRFGRALAHRLFTQYVPQQMEAPLPPPLKRTVAKARANYVAFVAKTNIGSLKSALQALGYGGPF